MLSETCTILGWCTILLLLTTCTPKKCTTNVPPKRPRKDMKYFVNFYLCLRGERKKRRIQRQLPRLYTYLMYIGALTHTSCSITYTKQKTNNFFYHKTPECVCTALPPARGGFSPNRGAFRVGSRRQAPSINANRAAPAYATINDVKTGTAPLRTCEAHRDKSILGNLLPFHLELSPNLPTLAQCH